MIDDERQTRYFAARLSSTRKEQGGAEYVQLKAIEKWDGKLPQVSGGNTPFINLSPAR